MRRWGEQEVRYIRGLLACLSLAALIGCARLGGVPGGSVPPELAAAQNALEQKDLPQATAQFDAFLQKQPGALSYVLVASLCSQNGRHQMAEQYAERGLATFPNAEPTVKVEIYNALANACLRLEDRAKAVQASKEAYALQPKSPYTMNGLAYAYAENNEHLPEALDLAQNAIRAARESRESEETIGTILDTVGWIEYKMKHYEQAIPALLRAVNLVSTSTSFEAQAEVSYHLAMAYLDSGKTEQARLMAERAYRADPGNLKITELLTKLKSKMVMPVPPQETKSSLPVL